MERHPWQGRRGDGTPVRRLALLAVVLLTMTACGGDAAETAEPDTAATAEPTTAAPETGGTTPPPAAGTASEPMAASTAAATATDAGESMTGPGGSTVMAAQSPLGEIVVDSEGLTLYLLTADSPEESVCTGGCASSWPPLTVEGEPTAGQGAETDLLGTITRDDGSTQVTYGGWPLYYFQGDAAPGDVNGQGIESAGGVWWVVSPSGEEITEEADAAAAQTDGY